MIWQWHHKLDSEDGHQALQVIDTSTTNHLRSMEITCKRHLNFIEIYFTGIFFLLKRSHLIKSMPDWRFFDTLRWILFLTQYSFMMSLVPSSTSFKSSTYLSVDPNIPHWGTTHKKIEIREKQWKISAFQGD